MSLSRYAGASLLLLLFGACSCDEDPLINTDPPSHIDAGFTGPMDAMGFADADAPDLGPPDSGAPEGRVLTFNGTSPVRMFFGTSHDLQFTLRTASGAAVAQETIRFTFAGTGGALVALSAITDAAGNASARFNAGAVAGQGTLTAEADRATPVTVSIEVREDPAAQLELTVTSTARITVATADALIYLGAPGTVPTCAQLNLSTPPATLMANFSQVPGTRTFAAQQTGLQVTAFASGRTARGDLVARGCTEGTRLAGGVTTRVQVTLQQLPSDLTGDYDAVLQVDLGAALPPPYGPVIRTITDVLSDPAGWAVYQTLAAADRNFGTFFVQWTPPGGTMQVTASFDDVRNNPNVFNTWRVASNALDNFLATQLGQAYIDVTNVGADIAQVIRRFEVGAGFSVTSTGTADRLQVVESWKAMVFQWQLGCPNGDLGCARRPIELSGPNAHLAPTRSTYGALVTHDPLAPPGETERFHLDLDPHQINLRYGAIVVLVLNELVFPNLPGSIAGNNLRQVLGNIVACSDLGIALGNATGLPASFFTTLCDTAVVAAATAIENQILALDSVNNPGLFSGTGGGELKLIDADHDLRTEQLRELVTYLAWSSGAAPPTSPVRGDGRKEASHCSADSDCAAGEACAPIAHYLRVRALERDCRRAVGAAAGGVGCALDADCASGMCFDPGTGVRICYGSCEPGGTCALGSCVAGAASIDLDPVLAGLGDATIAACVP